VSELQRSTTQQLTQGRQEQAESLNAANNSLLERFDKLQTGNESKLADIRQSIEAKLADNIEKNIGAFKEMTLGIAELKSTGQRIAQVGEEIGELTDILRSPKLRGDFGEFELENMIRDVIPPDHYQIKAQVNGALADAAISLKEGLLCIDSKFPLDNYRRAVDPALAEDERQAAEKAFEGDVKGHVEAIASRYIVPGITLDFALMFIPAESVYYQICLNQELQALCRQMKVLPVSPNTLYAYFQVLAIGFRGMKLQEAAKRIEEVLLRMKRDFDTFKNSFRLVGSHLQNAQNRFSDANIAAEQFSVTLDRLQFGSVEAPLVDTVAAPELPQKDSEPKEQREKPELNIADREV
jgi:DNA recombination protein RmuC